MRWPKSWARHPEAWQLLLISAGIVINAVLADGHLVRWLALLVAIPGFGLGIHMLWRAYVTRGETAVEIDSTSLRIWVPSPGRIDRVSLYNVVRIEWTSGATLALRLRSGALQRIRPMISRSDRATFFAELRRRLAERGPI